ncbi:MAG: LysR family transcriptional regulator [Rhizobiales bacterium]|nr:LysR family transcriptional regulator [Hyphomicrobiales bacterium]
MTLDQLRIFIMVAEREHMTQAASALGLTQSAVSAAIAALETRHDVKLFDRVGRRIELTSGGQTFLAEARAVVARAQAAELVLSELGAAPGGVLNVYASQTIASYWLPQRLVSFRQSNPRIDVRLHLGNTASVLKAVESGAADLGFVEDAVGSSILTADEIGTDEMVLVVAAGHPLAKRRKLSTADMMAADWIVREPGSGTRSQAEAALQAMGLDIHARRIVMELPSNESIRAAVEDGAGLAALSDLVVAESVATRKMHRFQPGLGRRAFFIVRHRDRHLSRAAQALMAHCQPATGRNRK